MKREITNKSIADLEKEGGRITDTKIRGFIARCLPSGKIQFGYQYGTREQRGWITIGLLDEINVAEARRRAEKCAGQVSDHRFARHLRDLVHNLGDVKAGQPRKKPKRVRRSKHYIRQHRE